MRTRVTDEPLELAVLLTCCNLFCSFQLKCNSLSDLIFGTNGYFDIKGYTPIINMAQILCHSLEKGTVLDTRFSWIAINATGAWKICSSSIFNVYSVYQRTDDRCSIWVQVESNTTVLTWLVAVVFGSECNPVVEFVTRNGYSYRIMKARDQHWPLSLVRAVVLDVSLIFAVSWRLILLDGNCQLILWCHMLGK